MRKTGSLSSQALPSFTKFYFNYMVSYTSITAKFERMARDKELTMNSRNLYDDRYHSGIRQENKKKTREKLGIVGNLVETSTACLRRYDLNGSVNTAIRTG